MCSSPKSGGANRLRQAENKSIAERLTSEQRARFTLVANRAQERREQRQLLNKRRQQRNSNSSTRHTRAGNSKPKASSIRAWFSKLYLAL
ncbi:hypothetical protein Q4574_18125 [Aliiglaciecola sp. 3_MG-2023]|uniref:hypothetical protein n=1 Tax=Aliiglaciecola sp. 3_MG-2023 TaxID=3062644 RepID=UPI0026E1F195|nr:hypothetical protein [Aliiglaciecola sp. 3_MG-2023]MDO6695221.1 hypothetical protein [Aliiglaciecola sp. 3_MG-2023]